MPIYSGGGGGTGGGIGAVLFDSTLGGDAASIDTGAAGIAQTQNILEVWIFSRTDEAVGFSNIAVTLNNDSSAIYDRLFLQNVNATPGGGNTLADTKWLIQSSGASQAAGVFGAACIWIPNYVLTTGSPQRSAFAQYSSMSTAATNTLGGIMALNYRSGTAISRLKIAPGGGTVLKAGTRLLILGR